MYHTTDCNCPECAGICQDDYEQQVASARSANLLDAVRATTATVNQCPYEGADARSYILGALRGMLASMAGESVTSAPALHPSCFNAETTKAVRQLVTALKEKA